jgi:predicted N-acetyltransferase YhbS
MERVERAITDNEVWVAALSTQPIGWLHRAGNSSAGLYVAPVAARRGVGAALVALAECRIARVGHKIVMLESSLNAFEFYFRLGYVAAGTPVSNGAVPMSKQVAGQPNPTVKRTNTGGAPLLASLAASAPLFAAYLRR